MDLLGVNNRKPVEHSEEGMTCRNIVILQGQILDRNLKNIPNFAA